MKQTIQHLVCVSTILFLMRTSEGIKNIKPKLDENVESLTIFPYASTETESETTTTELYGFESNSTVSALEETTSDNPIMLQKKEGNEGEMAVIESPNVLEVNFPENHKNFTANQYLGTGESPYYVYVNPYKQQYESYYEQKEFYGRKPIKFEDNTQQDDYLIPHKFDYNNEERKPVYSRFNVKNVKPFPYAFENHQFPEFNLLKGTQQHGIHEDRLTNWDHALNPNDHKQDSFHYDFPKKLQNDFDFSQANFFQVGQGDNYEMNKHKSKNPWKKILHLLTALVPLGLFLATLTPNIISVNSSSPGKIARQRSTNSENEFNFKEEDVLKLIKGYGVESLNESQCEDRIICELAKMGEDSAANSIEKGFLYLAHKTPQEVAARAGMTELFQAIRTGNCETFKCEKGSDANASVPLKEKNLEA